MENLDVAQIISLIVALVIAVVGHEIAHGWAAYKFGDTTAKNLGRLSINPVHHIDPLGTIVIPAALYLTTGFVLGWAKPVPINARTVMQNGGYKAMIAVSLAGIIYNFLIAALAFAALKITKNAVQIEHLTQILYMLIVVNLILGLFNLYPIPPLDGAKAVEYVLRSFNLHGAANSYSNLQRYGFIVLVIVMISPFKDQFFYPIKQAFYFVASLI